MEAEPKGREPPTESDIAEMRREEKIADTDIKLEEAVANLSAIVYDTLKIYERNDAAMLSK